MRLALRAAARGRTSPNPHVGAVIEKRGRVIAVGHHPKAGGPHAEIVALRKAGKGARGATIHVTLEPCNHFGRTPPCTDALVEAGVARVAIGARDPSGHTRGSIEKLEAAGIEVVTGVLRDEAETMIVDFAKHVQTGLPFVTLKSAVTLDGRTATRTGDSKWITGERARKEAHRLRSSADAVLTGIGTVIADDPLLTVRAVRGPSPLRAIADSRLRIDPRSAIAKTAGDVPTVVYHARASVPRSLARTNLELVRVRRDRRGLSLEDVLADLGKRGVVRLLVEAGAALSGALFDRGFVDRVAVFVAPVLVLDPEAMPLARGPRLDRLADAHRLSRVQVRALGPDVLVTGELTHARSWLEPLNRDNRRRA